MANSSGTSTSTRNPLLYSDTIQSNACANFFEKIVVSIAKVNLSKSYYFIGAVNYDMWFFRIKHKLLWDGWFIYYIMLPSFLIEIIEFFEKSRYMSLFMKNGKQLGLNLLKWYNNSYAY